MNSKLPIYDIEATLADAYRRSRRLLIRAPTGSGKSTQVPQMLLKNGCLGNGQVVVLQPRRIAARLLAARVADELGVPPGREVGYQVRFESVCSSATRIRYVTEGILLRQMVADPSLHGVSCVIFDEFHERHLYGDITLARARELQRTTRPDLALIVMSATLDPGPVAEYLAPCEILESEGRTFPVEIRYRGRTSSGHRKDEDPVWDQAAAAFAEIARAGFEGDALIFMPGAYEIQRTIAALRETRESSGRLLLPLHGELPPDQQDLAVSRHARPKVVVATNVAETSITIDGIRLVIDSGLARIPRYDPHRGINTLLVEKISQASADQRAGRAGRTAPGLCIRLWSEAEHRCRPAQEAPEVRRLDLAEAALVLKAAGFADLRSFPWLEPPDPRSLDRAETLLRDLGAADESTGQLTELGRRMLAFPVHPRWARMMVAASEYGGARQVALIAALTQGRDLFVRNVDRETAERREDLFGDRDTSDFFPLMRAWNYALQHNFSTDACRRVGIHAQAARQVLPLFEMFLKLSTAQGLNVEAPPADDVAVRKCILCGFADHVARRVDSGTLRCRMVHNRSGTLSRSSVVQKHPLFVAADVTEVEGREVEVQLALATAIEPEWLGEIFPGAVRSETVAVWDSESKRVFAENRTLFRDLILQATRSDRPPLEQAARILAERVANGELKLKRWDESVEEWITRANCLAAWCPELGLPILTAADRKEILSQICKDANSYKEIKDREIKPILMNWLTAEQRRLLDTHAPERIRLPTGRTAKVSYSNDKPPYFSATIQDLYGMVRLPKVAMDRVTLAVQILAPNQRPVQITQDLGRFWKDHYPRIKQELQRKYPKHEWR
ncbi:MAG: ATP-dependent helicase HrpB [Kiritimatiellae bacterium]|nr:ATP-dependent helicase HrpB [Kiritimatiellia bacterium]MDW8458172.1 ATP-dependent helicase HrpB [Verrucomicrobiota bacterium]